MTITLQFVAPGTFDITGDLIAWFNSGVVDHVDAVMPDGSLLGAQGHECGGKPSGVQIRPADYLGNLRTCRVTLPVSPEQESAWRLFLTHQLGKPYDFTGIAGFIAGRNWRHDGSWFCSELQAAALEACGYFCKLASPDNKITPQELLLMCSVLVPVTVVEGGTL